MSINSWILSSIETVGEESLQAVNISIESVSLIPLTLALKRSSRISSNIYIGVEASYVSASQGTALFVLNSG